LASLYFKFSVNCDEKLTGNELLLGESYYLNKEGLAILGMISIVTGENPDMYDCKRDYLNNHIMSFDLHLNNKVS
jgi:hypothetical protein